MEDASLGSESHTIPSLLRDDFCCVESWGTDKIIAKKLVQARFISRNKEN